MTSDTTAYFVGFLFLVVSDGLWTNFAIPRFYTSIQSDIMLKRVIRGENLKGGNFQVSDIYTETPTAVNRGLRILIFLISCSIPPALISYAVNRGISGGNAGAVLGFYAYYVFNATAMSISSWAFRDAVLDTSYGVISLLILGLIIEEMLV